MGDIGKKIKEVELEPLEAPAEDPLAIPEADPVPAAEPEAVPV
jgi:hypothetical protein